MDENVGGNVVDSDVAHNSGSRISGAVEAERGRTVMTTRMARRLDARVVEVG